MTTSRKVIALATIGVAGMLAYIGLTWEPPSSGMNLQEFLG